MRPPVLTAAAASGLPARRPHDDLGSSLSSLAWLVALQSEDVLQGNTLPAPRHPLPPATTATNANTASNTAHAAQQDKRRLLWDEHHLPAHLAPADALRRATAPTGQASNKSSERPQWSYSQLCFMAIQASGKEGLVLADIYRYITSTFPYFRHAGSGWKNSVRHNLSQNKCFRKLPAPKGQSTVWAIDASHPRVRSGAIMSTRTRRTSSSSADDEPETEEDMEPTSPTLSMLSSDDDSAESLFETWMLSPGSPLSSSPVSDFGDNTWAAAADEGMRDVLDLQPRRAAGSDDAQWWVRPSESPVCMATTTVSCACGAGTVHDGDCLASTPPSASSMLFGSFNGVAKASSLLIPQHAPHHDHEDEDLASMLKAAVANTTAVTNPAALLHAHDDDEDPFDAVPSDWLL